MENYSTNYGIVIKNTEDISEYLNYYFNYKIESDKTELTAKEIFDIISNHITKNRFGKYLLNYIIEKEPDFNNQDIDRIIKNGLINCTNIFYG